ncbi:MAG: hypothetical protein E7308_07615 [Butyrivibrio sp.]|nr:hypothetical protein [Butyrivibrio sp.]
MPSKTDYVERFLAAFKLNAYLVVMFEDSVAKYRQGNTSAFIRRCANCNIATNHDNMHFKNLQEYHDNLADSAELAIRLYKENAG